MIKADKGGKTVIWKRTDYELEANRQLNDSSTYEEISKDEADLRNRETTARNAILDTLRA